VGSLGSWDYRSASVGVKIGTRANAARRGLFRACGGEKFDILALFQRFRDFVSEFVHRSVTYKLNKMVQYKISQKSLQ
jgi:hypothetical protein